MKLPLLAVAFLLVACSGGGDAQAGDELYHQANIGRTEAPGCTTCHSTVPGEVKVGPSHAGVATRAADTIHNPRYTGQASNAEGYLRESILHPNAYVVEGYAPDVMFQRYEQTLTDAQLDHLVAYLMTLK